MNTEIKIEDLTSLEVEVIESIKRLDNPGYFFLEVSSAEPKKLRGAMASLDKKEVIDINTDFDGLVTVLATNLFPENFFND